MKTVIVISGPTGVGKTNVAIQVATAFGTEIISADSRQFYKEIPIGTATPTLIEQQTVTHHLISNLNISQYYNAFMFEQDALKVCEILLKKHDIVILAGGSGMYVDAFCNGIDLIPDIEQNIRDSVLAQFENQGIESLRQSLQILDPDYYAIVDLKNPKRLMRAIEVCLQTGKPYSNVRMNKTKPRAFNIIKIALNLPREELYQRINLRVEQMIHEGLETEAKSVAHLKDYTALKTVGYREFFEYFEGNYTKEQAIEKIKQNSRNYAKRQITWLNRDNSYNWFSPHCINDILDFIATKIQEK